MHGICFIFSIPTKRDTSNPQSDKKEVRYQSQLTSSDSSALPHKKIEVDSNNNNNNNSNHGRLLRDPTDGGLAAVPAQAVLPVVRRLPHPPVRAHGQEGVRKEGQRKRDPTHSLTHKKSNFTFWKLMCVISPSSKNVNVHLGNQCEHFFPTFLSKFLTLKKK